MQITNEVFQVVGGGFTSQNDGTVYRIKTDGHAVLVDAGCGNAHGRLMANIERLLSLEAEILCEEHFGVYKGRSSVRQFINTYLT